MSTFSLLSPPADPKYCALLEIAKDTSYMELPARGESIAGKLTDVRDYRMSASAPGLQIADVIKNAYGFLMVTEKLKTLIEGHAKGATIEYLAFRLLNHKNRVAADPCFIVNVLGRIDCADKAQSKGVEDAEYGEYYIARKISLIDAKLPPHQNIMRTTLFPGGVWVRDDLRKILEDHGVQARFVASGERI